ncbi:MAG: DUF4398 domain-containing protein [Xanthomonadaceae bacterium]|jgi:hypothetical protein|nr:DUF4398 domain-containing protein [Xanthomonadaceae bacterium]
MNSFASIAQFHRWLYVALIVIAIPFAAPAQEADQALRQAVQAVTRAENADADHYDAETIASARQALVQAQGMGLRRSRSDRAQAGLLAERAAGDADLAYARSIRARTEAALQERRARVAALRRELERAGGAQ